MKIVTSSSLTQNAKDQINDNFKENDDRLDALGVLIANTSVAVSYAASVTTDGIEATLQVVDGAGAAVAGIYTLNVWISDDADGSGLTATAASGALTVPTGTSLVVHTAKKHLMLNTDSAGLAKLLLVDIANTAGERFCVSNPVSGKVIVGPATVAANYQGGV